jgi:hypothetical protein
MKRVGWIEKQETNAGNCDKHDPKGDSIRNSGLLYISKSHNRVVSA